jgi:hypothetical protein
MSSHLSVRPERRFDLSYERWSIVSVKQDRENREEVPFSGFY